MTPAERAAAERAAQGLPEHVEDEATLGTVAQLLADEHDGGGAGAMTPPPHPTRHRRDQASAGADGTC